MVHFSKSFTRRPVLGMVAAVVLSTTTAAWAQSAWPNKPVKIVVPFAPGGTTDILARAVAPELTRAFGQQFVVENKGGAAGALGLAQFVNAAKGDPKRAEHYAEAIRVAVRRIAREWTGKKPVTDVQVTRL